MANILALDTSTDACSVALNCNGHVTSLFELAAKSHTQRLLPMVDELLQMANISLNDLDALAFGRGPGSFTGLRICMGVVQGLAFGANLPVIPVSTLSAMAVGYWRQFALSSTLSSSANAYPPVLVALDARMDEVYWALFTAQDGQLEAKALTPEAVSAPEVVACNDTVLAMQQEFVAIGPGWHYPGLSTILPAQVHLAMHPHAEDIARIAAEYYARGETIPISDAAPVYLRDSVSWQKRQRIRTAS
jgi:tRNA threonylcarbamoyladenosine biosynthesis protein TsaB